MAECLVCFSIIGDILGIYDCNHLVCLDCVCRLVFLSKDNRCPACLKENSDLIIIAVSDTLSLLKAENRYFRVVEGKDQKVNSLIRYLQENNDSRNQIKKTMKKYISGILILGKKTNTAVAKKIQHSCTLCDFIGKNQEHLVDHYKKHKKVLCNECVEHRKLFPSEWELFDQTTLTRHKKYGDNVFKGHLYCTFCSVYIYSIDLMKSHLVREHEMCVYCERNGKKHFYKNFEQLESHYTRVHYHCSNKKCFRVNYVFSNKGEYMKHMSSIHSVNIFELNDTFQEDLPLVSINELEETLGLREKNIITRPILVDEGLQGHKKYSNIPNFLDRSQITDQKNKEEQLLEFYKKIPEGSSVRSAIKRQNNGGLSPAEFMDVMLKIMDPKKVHETTLKCIPFINDKSGISLELKKLKSKIDFPEYKSKETKKIENSLHKLTSVYSVIDLSKTKKKGKK